MPPPAIEPGSGHAIGGGDAGRRRWGFPKNAPAPFRNIPRKRSDARGAFPPAKVRGGGPGRPHHAGGVRPNVRERGPRGPRRI